VLYICSAKRERQCWVKAERKSLKKGKCQLFVKGSTYIEDVGMGLSTWSESSVALIHTIFRIALIDILSRMDCDWVSLHRWNFCTLEYCIASSVRENFFGFFCRFIGEKNFAQQNCIALFDFFLKSCVSVSLQSIHFCVSLPTYGPTPGKCNVTAAALYLHCS
jgi:hypothetical protein